MMVSKDFYGRPKSMQQKLAKEVLMQSTLFGDHANAVKPSDKDLSDLLEKWAPTLDKQRLSRWWKEGLPNRSNSANGRL